MIDGTTLLLLIFGVLVLVFGISYIIIKKQRQQGAAAIGKRGEKDVQKALKKIARKNGYRVIHNIYLPLYEKTTQIDHIVIGAFGVVAIETKALNGDIYGTETEKNWTQIIGTQKNKHYNPLLQNKVHVDCIQHILRTENIYRVNVDSLVVFAGKKVQLNIPKGIPVITLDLLKKYFKKPRYLQDHQVDVQKVYNTLIQAQVTDNDKIKQHNQNVKKAAKNNRNA